MTSVDKNTTVSAVAILEHTNANQQLVDDITARAAAAVSDGSEVTAAIARAIVELSEASPETFYQVPYLMVHHNPFAVAPLPDGVFTGPHDRHFRYK
jgi:hypothetical protein